LAFPQQSLPARLNRISQIIAGKRSITADTARRCFGASPEFWINLQARYDLDVANRTLWHKIEREVAARNAT
jgi:addiction module HigA family antidote